MSAVTIPILPSADFDVTVSFWAGLDFAVAGRWPAEYLIVKHEELGIELHFWHDRDVDRWTNDVACYVRLGSPEEVRARHAGWAEVPVPEPARISAPEDDAAGACEFHVIDMHGNLVRIGGFPTEAME